MVVSQSQVYLWTDSEIEATSPFICINGIDKMYTYQQAATTRFYGSQRLILAVEINYIKKILTINLIKICY
jgi:hypothetical protein